jgi:GT2 family glycosyltransferase
LFYAASRCGDLLSLAQSNPVLSATVVICTHNRPDKLAACLHAISQLRYPEYNVLVVENGAADGRTRPLCEERGVHYLHSPIIGLSRARNDGARACSTELVAYTDDDALPHEDWLESLAVEFHEPSVMAAGGVVLPLHNGTERVQKQAEIPGRLGRERKVVDRTTEDWFAQTNFGGVGIGGNMCFRRAAFELWPGFDERLGRGAPLNSAEEHFAFFQLVLRGYQCIYTPRAIVSHPEPDDPEEVQRIHYKNLSNAVAYACLLWSEFPQVRGRLLKHLWSRSFGERSRIRADRDSAMHSWRKELQAIANGIRLFWKLPKPIPRTALIQLTHTQKVS